MAIVKQIDEDLKSAMKSGDRLKVSVLRMLRSAINYKQIDSPSELIEDEIVGVIDKEVKKRREPVLAYRGKRDDLADQEQQEMEILESYLPAGVSDQEIMVVINEVKASGEANPGKLIGMVMGKFKGKRVDGGRVKELVNLMVSAS